MKPEEILISPIKTEKAERLKESNQYVFRVNGNATKNEIKKAAEKIFKTKVEKVRIVQIPPKVRAFRGKRGFKSGYKKAIIKFSSPISLELK